MDDQSSSLLAPAEIPPQISELLRYITPAAEAAGLPAYDPIATADGDFFDLDRARLALDFFHECLHHVEGALYGQPFELQLWQQAYIANLFGWVRMDELGRWVRRYVETLLYVPRKNGKTPLAAGILNLVLFTDGEMGAQIVGAAADTEQAARLYDQASGQVNLCPALKRRAKIMRAYNQRGIIYEAERSHYRVISADAHTKHGLTLHMGVVDELHAQRDRHLVDTLATSTASLNRKQPLLLWISTADFEREGSICNEKHDYARKVRDGVVADPRFLPCIYEALPEDDWTDERTWEKANPNLDVSVSRDYLRRECAKAKAEPSYQNTVRRLHMNIRTQQAERWLDVAQWDDCEHDGCTIDQLEGLPCFGGLDLSSTQDLTTMQLVFPEADWAVLSFFWLPENRVLARSRDGGIPYDAWTRDGHITTTEGDVVDYDQIRADINAIGQRVGISEIAVDRWNATQLTTQLMGDGFEMVPFGQGFASMSAPSKELERRLVSRSLRHSGNPVMRWNVSNVQISRDAADNIKPDKKKSAEKIDGVVTLIMAIGRATAQEPDAGPSVYETRGMMEL